MTEELAEKRKTALLCELQEWKVKYTLVFLATLWGENVSFTAATEVDKFINDNDQGNV